MSSRSSQLVLITGASGFIGSEIALEALRQGFSVRLAVRKQSQADAFKAAYPDFASRITSTIVPDITVEGAFDEAVQGVDFVVHAASPVTFHPEDTRRDVLDPAINGTLSILRSAKQSPSIKAFAFTSSVVAHLDLTNLPSLEETLNDSDWNPVTLEQATAYPKEAGGLVYAASKALAERAAWKFVEEEKPSFALTTLSPTWVTGSSSEASLKTFADLRSSHGLTVQSLYGVKAFPDAGMASSFVDVQDVAKAHIGALTTPEAQGKRYLLVGGQFNYEEAAKAIVKAVPEAEKAFPHVEGKAFAPSFAVDASAAEKAFGFTYATLDESMARFGKQIASLPTSA